MALLKLEPTLKEQCHKNIGVLMEGFYHGSTKIQFSGSSESVHKAKEWFNGLLGQYKVMTHQCQAELIPSAIDRFTADLVPVTLCVKCKDRTICYAAQYATNQSIQVLLMVCGKEPAVQRALNILSHPEESAVVLASMEVLQKVKSQPMYNFSRLSQQHRVYIQELTTPTIVIRGYIKDRIAAVEKILNEAKTSLKKHVSTFSGSKVKLSCLTEALSQSPDQAQAFFITVFRLTSVQIIHINQTVKLSGPANKIKEAEKMIEDSEFLKGYHNQSFEFESHPNFMTHTKKYLSEKFSQQQLDVAVNCTMNKSKKRTRKLSGGDQDQPKDTFNVWIESGNVQHFDLACQIVKVRACRYVFVKELCDTTLSMYIIISLT